MGLVQEQKDKIFNYLMEGNSKDDLANMVMERLLHVEAIEILRHIERGEG